MGESEIVVPSDLGAVAEDPAQLGNSDCFANPNQRDTFPAAGLRIERVIGHEVYPFDKDGNSVSPLFSNSLSPLNPNTREIINDRVADALGQLSNSYPITFSNTSPGSFLDLVAKAISEADEVKFIELTKALAQLLADSQKRRNITTGVLIVVQAKASGNRPALLVFKCEKQAGLSASNPASNSFVVEGLRNLMLTPAGELYKVCAVVGKPGNHPMRGYDAYVYDNAVVKDKAKVKLSEFFVERFLGACIAESARTETFSTYKAFVSAIQATFPAGAEMLRVKYDLEAAFSEPDSSLADGRGIFSPNTFIDSKVPQEKREEVRRKIAELGVVENRVVLDLADLNIGKTSVDFENGIRLSGPTELLSVAIGYDTQEDGTMIITIPGSVRRLK